MVSRLLVATIVGAIALSSAPGSLASTEDAGSYCRSEAAMYLAPNAAQLVKRHGVSVTTRTSKDRTRRLSVATVPLERLRGGRSVLQTLAPSGASDATPAQLLGDNPAAVVAVNSSYANTVSFVADGPLVVQGKVLVMTRRDNSSPRPRAVTVDGAGVVRFGKLFSKGHVRIGTKELPLAGLNATTAMGTGVVKVQRPGWPANSVPVLRPLTVALVRSGTVQEVRANVTRLKAPREGYLLVSAQGQSATALRNSIGKAVRVRLRMSGSAHAKGLVSAVHVGAPLVRDGRIQVPCTGPAGSWESRPRVIVGVTEDALMLATVRATPPGRWEQYDSGLTLGGLGVLASKLGMHTAYALDGGASTQMVTRGRKGKVKLVDRTSEMRFSWQRPIPSALAISTAAQ